MAGAIYKGVQLIKGADGSWEICKSVKNISFPDRFASLEDAQRAIDAVLENIQCEALKYGLVLLCETPRSVELENPLFQFVFNMILTAIMGIVGIALFMFVLHFAG